MAKVKKAPEAWPYRIRAIYILLGVSVAVNVVTIATISVMASK